MMMATFTKKSIYRFAAGGLLAVSCLGILFFLRSGSPFPASNEHSWESSLPKAAYIGTKKYALEIAASEISRENGLGGRGSLCEECGMLFVFEEPGLYAFWMKEMRFSLDIVWLAGQKIVFVARNVPPDFPGIIVPPVPADRVLEINASQAEAVNIGDTIRFMP